MNVSDFNSTIKILRFKIYSGICQNRFARHAQTICNVLAFASSPVKQGKEVHERMETWIDMLPKANVAGPLKVPGPLATGSTGSRTCATGFAPNTTWPWQWPGPAAAIDLPWPVVRQHILEMMINEG